MPGPSTDADVEADILALVADKTGYPADMLALDLDLEADLGIDTVKQAEVFATIREHYGIERDDQLKLRDYPTLAHVIGFVHDRTPTTTPTTAAPTTTTAEPEPATVASRQQIDVADLTEADRFPRRVPSLTIRPLLEACAPTGVKLAAGTRVVVMADHGGVGSALAERLTERGVEVLSINGQLDARRPLSLASTDGCARVRSTACIGFPLSTTKGAIESMDLAAWREATRTRVKLLYATMRRLYEQIAVPGHVPHHRDSARRPARLRRGRSNRTNGWRRDRFRQGLCPRAAECSGEGRRLRSRLPSAPDR